MSLSFTWLNKTQKEFEPLIKYTRENWKFVEQEKGKHIFEKEKQIFGFCFAYKKGVGFFFYEFKDQKIIFELFKINEERDGLNSIYKIFQIENLTLYCCEKKWIKSKDIEEFVEFIEEKDIKIVDEILRKIRTNDVCFFNKRTLVLLEKIINYKTREILYLWKNRFKKMFYYIVALVCPSLIRWLIENIKK